MNINSIFGAKSSLDELLNKVQDSQLKSSAVGDTPTLLDPSLQQDTVEFSPSALARGRNMMSQNFVGGSTRDTKYLDAQMASAASVQNLQNSMSASLMSSIGPDMATLGAGMSAIGGNTSSIGEEVQEAIFWDSNPLLRTAKIVKDTTEAHEELLEEQKVTIETKANEAMASKPEETKRLEEETSVEAKAEEAMTPKDENGEPIEQVGETDSAPVEASDTAPSEANPAENSSTESEAKKEKSNEDGVLDIKTLLTVG